MSKQPAKVTKSYREGHVSLTVEASNYGGGSSVISKVQVDLPLADARVLHADLGQKIADADAKVSAKLAAEERRQKWRDREVAAGRFKIMSHAEFFKR